MLTKRIIPCLDVKEGRVVKGIQFQGLRDAGNPVELAKYYDQAGADELIFLDVSASHEGRQTMIDVVQQTAATISIPFTVGGGINTVDDMKKLLRAGADKISLNTAALKDPEIVRKGAQFFGSQCIVVAIDAKWDEQAQDWYVYTHGGRNRVDKTALNWVKEVEGLGAGEILLTSMDADGEKSGFNLELTKIISEAVQIPVIASGGAGGKEDFYPVFTEGKADAALAASIFHFKETTVAEVKQYLIQKGVEIRWP